MLAPLTASRPANPGVSRGDLYRLMDHHANRIEQVLASHRVMARVWNGTVAARCYQFNLTVPTGTKLTAVSSIDEEIAMALGVDSVRVYRQNMAIVVEVPHDITPRVTLRGLMSKLSGHTWPGLTACLGVDMQATPVGIRLDSPNVVHVLISGTTGCGKTELMRTMVLSLAIQYSSQFVKLLLVDPKGRAFAGLPDYDPKIGRHLLGPVARGEEQAADALEYAVETMRERDLQGISTPAILVAVDEIVDLIQAQPKAGELLQRLAQRGREAGIHVIAGTQKPAASVMSTVLRANFPARIVGRVATAEDARMASGITGSGAEKLQGRGDFLLLANREQIRFQAAQAVKE